MNKLVVNELGEVVPTKKVRIEILNNGDRYIITFEGQVTRDKALRLLDLVELLGGMPEVTPEFNRAKSEISKIDKVRLAAQKNFPIGWFSSKELQSAYEKQFNEPIRLSTVSTYLSRLSDRGFIIKKNVSNKLQFKMMTALSNKLHER